MKTKTLLVSFCLLLASVGIVPVYAQTSNAANAKGPQIAFAEKSHDFGDIHQGDKVNYTFKFTNSGTEPLIISKVETTCGCTATDWTKDPVGPGKSGEVSATFNSTGKSNVQRKVITIYSNAITPKETVTIITNVLPKPTEE